MKERNLKEEISKFIGSGKQFKFFKAKNGENILVHHDKKASKIHVYKSSEWSSEKDLIHLFSISDENWVYDFIAHLIKSAIEYKYEE